MKYSFLLDENLSWKISKLLPDFFKNCKHVENVGLAKAQDIEIWNYARQNNLVIITKDNDFNYLSIKYNYSPKIIWIRCGNVSTIQIAGVLNNSEDQINEFLLDDTKSLIEIQ
jgi:predicted nuclease of predicted toxin-antitoxin system